MYSVRPPDGSWMAKPWWRTSNLYTCGCRSKTAAARPRFPSCKRHFRGVVMESNAPLPGPDLEAGVPLGALPASGVLAGHAGGEAVLLVRRDPEWFAIGSVCTHYSGPLAEGLIVGETVRCPWHHACFSLRTGDAARPPALNPVSCWDVEERSGRVFVTGKTTRPARQPGVTTRRHPGSIVIVGAGAAGECAAETLRHEEYSGKLTLYDADPDAPCGRPNLSKDYLAGTASEDWIPLHSPEFYQDLDIKIMRRQVVSLNPAARRIVLDNGSSQSYDALLLATGASPIRLPGMAESGTPEIRYLRTLADSRAIVDAALQVKRAVILGASFIGLEVAASLRARGLEVHAVGPDTVPLGRILGPELGRFVHDLHQEHGVVFHLGHTARTWDGQWVTLDDGTRIPADMVVAGVGVRPNVELAVQAGLAVDAGILVDQRLETSAPGVFAAGDVAHWIDPRSGDRVRVEHWVVAERM